MRFQARGKFVLDLDTGIVWSAAETGHVERRMAEGLLKRADLRLPTVDELLTIVDRSRIAPAIKSNFPDCKLGWYWSSTPYAGLKDSWWGIDFSTGKVSWSMPNGNGYARGMRP